MREPFRAIVGRISGGRALGLARLANAVEKGIDSPEDVLRLIVAQLLDVWLGEWVGTWAR